MNRLRSSRNKSRNGRLRMCLMRCFSGNSRKYYALSGRVLRNGVLKEAL